VKIEQWELHRLRPHPENARIFGDPEESEQFDSIKADIKKRGIDEPLRVLEGSGRIISGHLRLEVARQLGMKTVPVVVVAPFADYRSELEALIKSNTERRQLSKQELAHAFAVLKSTPRAEGGTKGKRGGDGSNQHSKKSKGGSSTTIARSEAKARDAAAATLGIGANEARALETVFLTPGVPKEVQDAVNRGEVKPTPVARAIREEVKAHGEVRHPSRLLAVVEPKVPRARAPHEEHADRMEREAEGFRADFARFVRVYSDLNTVLGKRPLKTVLGPTEHAEWLGLCRDVARRAWAEVESVQGPTNMGRQMALTVIDGGAR
jgi:hypothetical protein